MGFAAGKAARQCIVDGLPLQNVSISAVQQAIEAGGQSLNLSDYGDYLRRLIHVHEHAFGDERPFAQCHASSLVQFRNNKMLVVWFGGSHEGNDDVGIWCAERFQTRWSSPRLLAKVDNRPHWNPVLFVDANGRLHLYFKVGRHIQEWVSWTMTSDDEGATWTTPRELVSGDREGRGPVKNKPIRLASGAWLAGASMETEDSSSVFVDRSEDGGATWQATDPLLLDRNVCAGKAVIQPTLWESEPGHVHMLMRSTCGLICRSDSRDDGRTWSPIYATELPNNNSGLDIARLYDGTLALVCNPVAERVRTPLSILLSFDNGHTWPRRLDIESEPGEYSYPAIIPTPVGMAITYTWRRERIAFWLGSIERVPA
ncbi:exo-alpha-sialidase [Chloroflexi bacterium TSY]|nr:exo-alpha-sialidase [Chloroflexi bacterium TSY]